MFFEVYLGFWERTKAYQGAGAETFVITAPGAFARALEGKLNAAILNSDDVTEKDTLDIAGTAAATLLSQDLLLGGSEKLSEKTNQVIQKRGRLYAFIPGNLGKLLAQLAVEITGLLSMRQAA